MAASDGRVVLRVKRKRTQDPAEALAIRCKAIKLDGDTEEPSVFRLCGTVQDEQSCVLLDLVRAYSRRQDLVKVNPLSKLTLSDHKADERVKRKEASALRRYHMVSKLRETLCDKGPLEDAVMGVYDVEPVEQDDTSCSSDGIMCNSSVMSRECVTSSTLSISDYVYDVYCGDGVPEVDSLDWQSVTDHVVEYVHDIIDSDCYDDEDDSNDEDNWRNDYPDEGDSSRSSAESSEDLSYRHREDYYYDANPSTCPIEYCED